MRSRPSSRSTGGSSSSSTTARPTARASCSAATSWPDAVTVVFHDRNRRQGCGDPDGAASMRRGEFAAILDADLEYAADDLAPVLEPLLAGDATGRLRHPGLVAHSRRSASGT